MARARSRICFRLLAWRRVRPVGDRHDGYMLIEVMVGALLLVVIGIGIYAGMDGASKASGRNRDRSVAVSLAQQDQERMRTMDAAALQAYIKNPLTRTVTVGNIAYQVQSKATLAGEAADATCTDAASSASFLRITSIATDPTGANKPIRLDSLMAPRSKQISATVKVVGADLLTGVPDVPVNLVEDSSKNDVTDVNGCVQFGFLQTTTYRVTITKPGYVDKDGNTSHTNKPISAVQNGKSVSTFEYAPGGTLNVNYRQGQTANPTVGRGFTVQNNGMSVQLRSVPTGSTATSGTLPNLFPFANGYKAWAGDCVEAQPGNSSPYLKTVLFQPPAVGAAVTLDLPLAPVPVYVTRNSSAVSGADLIATDVCTDKYPKVNADSAGRATLYLPLGAVDICADTNGSSPRRRTVTINNTGSLIEQTIDIQSQSGSCS